MGKLAALFLSIVVLPGCSEIDTLLWQPKTSPEQWCEAMPCVEILSTGIILDQPVSTFLVYSLGVLWLWAGWRFWIIRNGQKSRIWWSISLALGGIAAISAGTSYQAFGYELKCAEREFCVWTSWWEIVYLLIQQVSLNAMLIAVAYSCTTGLYKKSLIAYAYANIVVHWCLTLAGITLANKFMISFEMLVLFSLPAFTLFLILNSWRYIKYRQSIDLALLGAWIILAMTNLLYFAYLQLDYTQALWQQGIWFSENDILHVSMAVWILYLGLVVSKRVEDAPREVVR